MSPSTLKPPEPAPKQPQATRQPGTPLNHRNPQLFMLDEKKKRKPSSHGSHALKITTGELPLGGVGD